MAIPVLRPKEWTLGFNAWFNEGEKARNPYDEGTYSHSQWKKGYDYGRSYDFTPSGKTRKSLEDHLKGLDDLSDEYAIWPTGTFI